MTGMYGEFLEGSAAQSGHREGSDPLMTAVAAMQREPGGAHTVSTLARRAGMSRSNFAESFRLRFGRSPMEFLRALRMDRAAELLRADEVPIKLVGPKVGYDSRASFSHAFRRCFGLSPAEFRDAQTQHSPNDIHAVSERLRTLAGPAQELTWEVDLKSGKVWWSEGTFSALGFNADARLISDVARFYERVHPEDREQVVHTLESACVSGRMTWECAFRFRRADNDYAAIRNGCVILRDRDGGARRLVGAIRIDLPRSS
jgi:AraC-like DNA-binding protein